MPQQVIKVGNFQESNDKGLKQSIHGGFMVTLLVIYW